MQRRQAWRCESAEVEVVGYPDFDGYKICATYHHAVNNLFSRAQIFKEKLSPSFFHRETLLVLLK